MMITSVLRKHSHVQTALHEHKEFIMGTRRHTRAPKITLITSSIAVTRAKRVSFSRLQTLLEAKVQLHVQTACHVFSARVSPLFEHTITTKAA